MQEQRKHCRVSHRRQVLIKILLRRLQNHSAKAAFLPAPGISSNQSCKLMSNYPSTGTSSEHAPSAVLSEQHAQGYAVYNTHHPSKRVDEEIISAEGEGHSGRWIFFNRLESWQL